MTGNFQKRKIYNAAMVASLILCVVTIIFWARSYHCRDVFTYKLNNNQAVWIELVRGGGQIVAQSNTPPDQFSTGWSIVDVADPLPATTFLGFGVFKGTIPIWDGAGARQIRLFVITVPLAAVTIATAIFPIWHIFRMMAKRNGGRKRGQVEWHSHKKRS